MQKRSDLLCMNNENCKNKKKVYNINKNVNEV